MQIVWFKRDLRVHDHEALSQAASHGPVLPLYILEPALWAQPDMSHRHYAFLKACLEELDEALAQRGQRLIIKVGEAVPVLQALAANHKATVLWSHQETWNHWTYDRDLRVKAWAKSQALRWIEPRQFGIERRLADRGGWAGKWQKLMDQPTYKAPAMLEPFNEPSDPLPSAAQLGLEPDGGHQIQAGGRKAGAAWLKGFFHERGQGYTREMSSPVTAFEACSRVSPYLSFGSLSMREVHHATERRTRLITELPKPERGRWPSAMRSFAGRLRWHCHFMQKLEDAPRFEFSNQHSAYDALRPAGQYPERLQAWQNGMTGYPLVDACMRALTATGYLNFRMRAMVMSFASYHLWLDWREPALHLARMFTDYEPGIHYCQAQMQSGTTGINTIRIYNPLKQSQTQDPDGVFIRQWIPELRDMPKDFLHTPWLFPERMGGYPMPLVDEKTARKYAADTLFGLRKGFGHRPEAKRIAAKHGSRKSGVPRPDLAEHAKAGKRKQDTRQDNRQGSLF